MSFASVGMLANIEEAEHYYLRGIEYLQNGLQQQAVTLLTSAINIDPNCAAYYYDRSRALTCLKQDSAALKDLDACLSLDDRHKNALFDKALLLFHEMGLFHETGQLRAALSVFEKAKEAGSSRSQAWIVKCKQLIQTNEPPSSFDKPVESSFSSTLVSAAS